MPWGTGSFPLISGVSRHQQPGSWQIITLLRAGKGKESLAVRRDLQTLPILELIWERQPKKKNNRERYFNRAISARQAGQFVTQVTHLILTRKIKGFPTESFFPFSLYWGLCWSPSSSPRPPCALPAAP